MSSVYKLSCPACLGPLRVRNSHGDHPCLRRTYYQCVNLACGATYVGNHEITHQISPSGLETPVYVLPPASSVVMKEARRLSASDDKQLDLIDLVDAAEEQQHAQRLIQTDPRDAALCWMQRAACLLADDRCSSPRPSSTVHLRLQSGERRECHRACLWRFRGAGTVYLTLPAPPRRSDTRSSQRHPLPAPPGSPRSRRDQQPDRRRLRAVN